MSNIDAARQRQKRDELAKLSENVKKHACNETIIEYIRSALQDKNV